MTETVTITHHQTKPEYQWEFVIPEGPTVLVKAEKLRAALEVLGISGASPVQDEIAALPNGNSRSVNADVGDTELKELSEIGVKTVQPG